MEVSDLDSWGYAVGKEIEERVILYQIDTTNWACLLLEPILQQCEGKYCIAFYSPRQ
jgi:hypothetical protein